MHGSLHLKNGFNARERVQLEGAVIDGSLDCRGGSVFVGSFGRPSEPVALEARGIHVGGRVRLKDFDPKQEGNFRNLKNPSKFKSDGIVRFSGATIGDDLEFVGAEFTSSNTTGLQAPGATIKGTLWLQSLSCAPIDLTGATVGVLKIDDDGKGQWPKNGDLQIDGLTYTRMISNSDAATSKWLDEMPDKPFRPQPYRQFADVLVKSGNESMAEKTLIQMEDERRANGNLSHWGTFSSWFLRETLLYGYGPYRILLLFLLVPLGSLFVWIAKPKGLMLPTDTSSPRPLNELSPFWYSLNVFLPIINLNQEKHWWPKVDNCGGTLLRIYLWIEILAGWFVGTLFLAALTGLIRKP